MSYEKLSQMREKKAVENQKAEKKKDCMKPELEVEMRSFESLFSVASKVYVK